MPTIPARSQSITNNATAPTGAPPSDTQPIRNRLPSQIYGNRFFTIGHRSHSIVITPFRPRRLRRGLARLALQSLLQKLPNDFRIRAAHKSIIFSHFKNFTINFIRKGNGDSSHFSQRFSLLSKVPNFSLNFIIVQNE